jgi:hypothetical protein
MNTPNSSRLSFLDLFRGAFALVMLEGHTFRAVLHPALKDSTLFQYHELIHNLPGPAFLFASGVAFSISTCRYWDSYTQWGVRSGSRLLRLIGLLVFGYMLHAPYVSLRRILWESSPEQVSLLLNTDILQCIAISGIVLQVVVFILRKQKWFFTTAVLGSVIVALSTPFLWDLSKHMRIWPGTIVGGNWGSFFPLFPYIGFELAGAAWGALYVFARSEGNEAGLFRKTFRFSAYLSACSFAAAFLPLPQAYSDFWTTSPLFFFLRLGVLGLLAVACRRAESFVLPHLNTLVVLGRESLLVYTAHLLLLYGSVINPDANLLKILGTEKALTETTLILLFLIASLALLAWTWKQLKEGVQWGATGIRLSLATYLAYCLVKG